MIALNNIIYVTILIFDLVVIVSIQGLGDTGKEAQNLKVLNP